MDSARRASRSRLQNYPKLLSSCAADGTAYAKCVSQHMGGVTQGQCNDEFQRFKACLQKAAQKMGTRL